MMKERECQKYKCMYNDRKILNKGIDRIEKLSMRGVYVQTFDQGCRCTNFRSKVGI